MRRRSGGSRRRHDGVLMSISLRAGVRGRSNPTLVGRAKRDHHDKARADNRRHPRLHLREMRRCAVTAPTVAGRFVARLPREATASRNSGWRR
jgi:hypothetical protein